MLAIYRPHVEGSSVSFEYELPSVAEFQQRIRDTLKNYPWLVCEDESGITGYAYAASYRIRLAYQWNVETSVYVRDDQHRKGVGRKLYEHLLPLLKKQGLKIAYAAITLPNDKSVKFHESFGFSYLCTYPKVGFKLGKWHDVGWLRLEIGPTQGIPTAPIPFSNLMA